MLGLRKYFLQQSNLFKKTQGQDQARALSSCTLMLIG